jgi:hypothetical protein
MPIAASRKFGELVNDVRDYCGLLEANRDLETLKAAVQPIARSNQRDKPIPAPVVGERKFRVRPRRDRVNAEIVNSLMLYGCAQLGYFSQATQPRHPLHSPETSPPCRNMNLPPLRERSLRDRGMRTDCRQLQLAVILPVRYREKEEPRLEVRVLGLPEAVRQPLKRQQPRRDWSIEAEVRHPSCSSQSGPSPFPRRR